MSCDDECGLISRRRALALGLFGTGTFALRGTAAAASATAPTTIPISDEAKQRAKAYDGMAPTKWGLAVPGVITRINTKKRVLALTFDACGGQNGSGIDEQLIGLLRQEKIKATLFLNGRWIDRNPKYTAELARDPLFELENHGWRHRPLSTTGQEAYGIRGTTSAAEVVDEVLMNHRTLAQITGVEPRFFRPGTAFCDEVAVKIVRDLGERVVGFTMNADAGATSPTRAVISTVEAAKAGDISIGHFNRPKGSTFEGFATAIPALKAAGFTFVKLAEVSELLV